MGKFSLGLYFAVLLSSSALAENRPCLSITSKIKIEEITATASPWANFRNQEGSLRYESKRLLQTAENQITETQLPTNLCPSNCQLDSTPEVIFESIPKKFLSNYADKNKCEQLLEQTKLSPLEYKDKTFNNMDKFADWFSDLSQGSGKDGKDLYSRCAGSCSPQYTSFVSFTNNSSSVDISVICGPARDKDNNQYLLTTYYLWKCHNAF